MSKRTRIVTAAIVGAFGLGLFATSSFASGPIILGPAVAPMTAPKVSVSTVTPVRTKILNTYRQVRAFWLARAIVR